MGPGLCIDYLFLVDQATLPDNLYDLYLYTMVFPQQMIKNGLFIRSDYVGMIPGFVHSA